jgi:hypothetical protein
MPPRKIKILKITWITAMGYWQRRKSKTKIGRNNGSMFVRFICGHWENIFGGITDGLVDLDSIVEIKCPFAARNTDIKTAIEKKLIFRNESQGWW